MYASPSRITLRHPTQRGPAAAKGRACESLQLPILARKRVACASEGCTQKSVTRCRRRVDTHVRGAGSSVSCCPHAARRALTRNYFLRARASHSDPGAKKGAHSRAPCLGVQRRHQMQQPPPPTRNPCKKTLCTHARTWACPLFVELCITTGEQAAGSGPAGARICSAAGGPSPVASAIRRLSHTANRRSSSLDSLDSFWAPLAPATTAKRLVGGERRWAPGAPATSPARCKAR